VRQNHLQQDYGKNPKGTGKDMVRDPAEQDARQGGMHALRSAGIRGNSALERSRPREHGAAAPGGSRGTRTTGSTAHVAPESPRGGWQRHPDVRWSESRAILPYGRNRKAMKSRGGSEPPLPALSPLGLSRRSVVLLRRWPWFPGCAKAEERLPRWGTVRADARRPCCALGYGRRSFGSVFACRFAPRLRRDRLRRGYHGSAWRPRSSGI
jgi:hypothetical protein